MTNDPGSFAAAILALANGATSSSGIPSAGQATSTVNPYANFVWMGQRAPKYSPGRDALITGPNRVAVPTSQAEAYAINLLSNDKARAKAYARVSEATGQKITSFTQFKAAWDQATGIAAQSWEATKGGTAGTPLTVWDVFDLTKREGDKYGTGAGHSTTTVTHNTSVDKLSDGSVWQVLSDAAAKSLGRAPTHNELRNFASKANQVASANPTRSTTTTTSSAGGSSSHTTTQQGASAGDYELAAQNQANANPEAGAYQAASTYYSAFLNAIGSVA